MTTCTISSLSGLLAYLLNNYNTIHLERNECYSRVLSFKFANKHSVLYKRDEDVPSQIFYKSVLEILLKYCNDLSLIHIGEVH